jgi:hypothetical protein
MALKLRGRNTAARQRLRARLAEAERLAGADVPSWAKYYDGAGNVYLLPNKAAMATLIESSTFAEPEPQPGSRPQHHQETGKEPWH